MAMAWSRISSKVIADPPPLPEACTGWSRDGRAFCPLYSADGGQRKARSTEDPQRRGTTPCGLRRPALPRAVGRGLPSWETPCSSYANCSCPKGLLREAKCRPTPLLIRHTGRLATLATLAGGLPPAHTRQKPPR